MTPPAMAVVVQGLPTWFIGKSTSSQAGKYFRPRWMSASWYNAGSMPFATVRIGSRSSQPLWLWSTGHSRWTAEERRRTLERLSR
jgi:hypothetical protein